MRERGGTTGLSGYAAVARSLVEHGVDVAFSVLGDANLYIVHSLVNDHGVRHVAATHEANAVLMADGYARVTNRVGVATVTHGPGLTNTVTALTEAVRARTPLLLVCGDTPVVARQNLQDIDQREVVSATGAGFHQVRTVGTIAEDVAIAIRRIRAERRPVVLNLPVDFGWAEAPYAPVRFEDHTQVVRPDLGALDAAVGVIASAKRPLVLAGRGAIGHRDELLALADRIGAPVATTLLAKGLFSGAPNDLGVMGTLSSPSAAEVIAEADVVVAFGAALNRYTTSHETFLDGKAVVQVDRDPAAIGRWSPVAAPVHGDVGPVAALVLEWLEQAEVAPTTFVDSPVVRAVSSRDPRADFTDRSTDTTIDVRTAMIHLDQVLPADRVIATDAGRFIYQSLPYLGLPRAGSFAGALSFGSIGLGMGMAIGAAVGRPEVPVVAVFGDGGFMMGGLAELSTAVREGLDLIAIVVNDASYGAEHVQLRRKGLDPSLSMFEWPSLAGVAEAIGARGITVSNHDELDAVSTAIDSRDRPLVIELRVDPDVISEES